MGASSANRLSADPNNKGKFLMLVSLEQHNNCFRVVLLVEAGGE